MTQENAMTYYEALERLAAMGPELAAKGAARKFTLAHIRALLGALENPQKRFPSVLIAGTNGKGSTAATLASIANAAGLRTGLYTSPHLLRVNERIRVSDGGALVEIGDGDFARVFSVVDERALRLVGDEILPHYPSFFELLTAIAFVYFAEREVELAVLEVGLGGRLDATNSVEPLVSVITDIALDHMEYLGNTLPEIAREKAGILRENGVLVTLSQHPQANQAIGEKAMEKNVRGVDAARFLPPLRGEGFGIREQGLGAPLLARNRYELSVGGQVVRIDSPLAGQHQQRNIALAVATAVELRTNQSFQGRGFAIPNAAIEKGVRETVWPGRLEWIASADAARAPLLLDVAHNPAGAWTLRAALAQLPEERPRTLIFSCLKDKQIAELAQVLFPLFDSTSGDPLRARDHIVLAPIQNPRAATVDELLEAAAKLDVPAHAAPHLPGALAQAWAITPPEGIIVATGSVFLVGELRALALVGE
ncbi:MAG TPA: folylpolyglutamate synthase/dihydrofolate synthase family protein [Acidobacteriaceae bacterium]|nr:folylpolyglutamate synthase/dihydrofolate synthase family protein [Acidobacteriaceae bacterium]